MRQSEELGKGDWAAIGWEGDVGKVLRSRWDLCAKSLSLRVREAVRWLVWCRSLSSRLVKDLNQRLSEPIKRPMDPASKRVLLISG